MKEIKENFQIDSDHLFINTNLKLTDNSIFTVRGKGYQKKIIGRRWEKDGTEED